MNFSLKVFFSLCLCQVFNMLTSFSFCSNQTMNSPHKLGCGMVGDWHLMLLLVSLEDSMSFFFFFFLALLSFFCTWAFSSCSKQKRLSNCLLCQLFTAVATLVAEHKLWSTSSVLVLHGLSYSGAHGILSDQGSNLGRMH